MILSKSLITKVYSKLKSVSIDLANIYNKWEKKNSIMKSGKKVSLKSNIEIFKFLSKI